MLDARGAKSTAISYLECGEDYLWVLSRGELLGVLPSVVVALIPHYRQLDVSYVQIPRCVLVHIHLPVGPDQGQDPRTLDPDQDQAECELYMGSGGWWAAQQCAKVAAVTHKENFLANESFDAKQVAGTIPHLCVVYA